MRAAKSLSRTDAGFVRGADSLRPLKLRFYSRVSKRLVGGNNLARAAVWPLEGSLTLASEDCEEDRDSHSRLFLEPTCLGIFSLTRRSSTSEPYEWQFPTPLALPHMRMTNKEISR